MKNHLVAIYLALGLLLTSCSMAAPFKPKRSADEFFSDPRVAGLAEAAARGNTRRVEELLKDGVDINTKGKDGMTPLLFTMLELGKTGYQQLLERGADPNLAADNGWSVMMFAARAEDIAWLRLAIKHGGNPNLIARQDTKPPLHDSIVFNRKENMRLLLANGADINLRDGTGGTALLTAAAGNDYDIVYELLERGADFRLRDLSNATIVDYIAHSRADVDHRYPQTIWRGKVIAWLKDHGVKEDLTPGQPGRGKRK